MNVLGINFGHDAGISLVCDGEFRMHWEKERHARIRYALGISSADILSALDFFGMDLVDIDRVALSSAQVVPIMLDDELDLAFSPRPDWKADVFSKLVTDYPGSFWKEVAAADHILHSAMTFAAMPRKEILVNDAFFPNQQRAHTLKTLVDRAPYPPASQRDQTIDAVLTIRGRPIPAIFVGHHLCHAWYAYAQSGYQPSIIISFDGHCSDTYRGGGIYFAQMGNITPIVPHAFYFGPFFSLLPRKLGLGALAAGKLMGLAAWGRPIYYEPKMIGNLPDAWSYFSDVLARHAHWLHAIEHWLSQHRVSETAFELRQCETPPIVAADIAASLQAMYTTSILRIVETAEEIAHKSGFDYTTIALTGGGALNCPSNSAIAAPSDKKVFVPPAVNDEGNSVGAALLCANLEDPQVTPRCPRGPADIAFKGKRYALDPATLARLEPFERIAAPDPAAYLAQQIAEGAVAAVFEGAAEIGPRALGHRSIIASPLQQENWRRLNRIKSREPWRPFAPIVLAEDFERYFDGCPADSYYMLFNARVKGFDLPAITHRDGSARVQVAVPEIGFVHRLLMEFKKLTGVGVLVNTSFNGPNEPIVETPADAIAAFAAMALDYLYLDGVLVKK